MIYRGKLVREDIGPGVWRLVAVGQSWVLRGAVPPGLAGQAVEVEAEPDGGPGELMGFEMSGPVLRVRRISAK